MLGIFTLIKGNKMISSVLLIISLSLGAMYIWSGVKEGLISQGYESAVTEYQAKMLTQQNKNIKDTEDKLVLLRASLQAQYTESLARAVVEKDIDTTVLTNIDFIEKEVYIEKSCNTIDPDLIRMFNKAINGINTSEQH
mgnify:CR=1 FL=1